jgi:hypothetical protein
VEESPMPSSGSLWLPPVLDFSSSSFAGRAERAGIFALMQRSLPLNLQVGRVIVQTQLGNTCYIRPMSALCNGFHVSLQQNYHTWICLWYPPAHVDTGPGPFTCG